MIIGIPRELAPDERRVGLSPSGVHSLCRHGADVLVERGAGLASGFSDESYRAAGAVIAADGEEVYRRSDLLVKVQRPQSGEVDWIREDQILLAFLHLPTCTPDLVDALRERGATAIDYSAIQASDGQLPVLAPMSQIAGRIVPQIAARFLQTDHGGNGILLGGLPGVPPAEAVILGGGTAGRNAARALLGAGARVTVLDRDLEVVRELHWQFGGCLTTYLSTAYNIDKALGYADVVVGAVRIGAGRTPVLVEREQVERMRDGSVIIDLSIDQGGCFATSRPMRPSDPAYVVHGITHICVPNLPSLVARTSTHALVNAVLPLLRHLAAGVASALREDPALAAGVGIFHGRIVDPRVAAVHGGDVADLTTLLAAEE